MKKVLCFALVVILAIAPMAVFADYDNGNNGYENGYENGNDCCPENGNDYENGNDNDNEDVTPVYVDDTDEGIEAITIDLAQRWTFGMGDEADERWQVLSEGGVFDPTYGYVNAGTSFTWFTPYAGLFYITGTVFLENASFSIRKLVGGYVLAEGYDFYELHFELDLEEGDVLLFSVQAIDEDEEATANWSVVIREVILLDIEECEECEDYEADDYEVEEYEEEYEEELVEEVNPLAYVEIRVVDGVEFVRIRAAANAFGFYEMSWDADTYTATIVGLEDYPVVIPEVGGFFDSAIWINYVPLAWALEFFA